MMHTAMILSATEMNGNKVRKLYKLFDTPASARIKKHNTVSLPTKGHLSMQWAMLQLLCLLSR